MDIKGVLFLFAIVIKVKEVRACYYSVRCKTCTGMSLRRSKC